MPIRCITFTRIGIVVKCVAVFIFYTVDIYANHLKIFEFDAY